MEVSGQIHVLATLPLEKELLVCIGQEAEWNLELVWTQCQGRKSQYLLGIEPWLSSP
jgi:hypothetical protein